MYFLKRFFFTDEIHTIVLNKGKYILIYKESYVEKFVKHLKEEIFIFDSNSFTLHPNFYLFNFCNYNLEIKNGEGMERVEGFELPSSIKKDNIKKIAIFGKIVFFLKKNKNVEVGLKVENKIIYCMKDFVYEKYKILRNVENMFIGFDNIILVKENKDEISNFITLFDVDFITFSKYIFEDEEIKKIESSAEYIIFLTIQGNVYVGAERQKINNNIGKIIDISNVIEDFVILVNENNEFYCYDFFYKKLLKINTINLNKEVMKEKIKKNFNILIEKKTIFN